MEEWLNTGDFNEGMEEWLNTGNFNEWMEEWLNKDISINEWKSTVYSNCTEDFEE